MAELTKIEAIRFSQEDIEMMAELRKLQVNPHQVVRLAFREKMERDWEHIVKQQERKNKPDCPF